MGLKKLLLPALIIISSLILNNCKEVVETTDECEKTKWQEVKEPIFYVYGTLQTALYINNKYSLLDTAHHVEAVGFVQKYYCNGTPSGKFDFDVNYYPDTGQFPQIIFVKLGQALQIKFQNDKDHVRVNVKWRIYYNNGLTYESETLVENFYFKDIKYNLDVLNQAIIYDCFPGQWIKVSG